MFSVIGSSLSIGMGIVGALLLSGVGLMATAAAISITPIVLGAVVTGIYGFTLARDSLVLRGLRKQTQKMEKHLISINKELSISREVFLSHFIQDLKNTELTSIQAEIEKLRTEMTHSPASQIAHEITELCEKRNNLIAQNNVLSHQVHDAYQKDPRITRITLQRVRCLQALHKMEETKTKAKKKVGLSTLSMVSFALVFAALFIPGVGALVVGGVAAAAIVTVSATRVYDYYRRKQIVSTQKINKNNAKTQDEYKSCHTSVLRIDKKLFAHHQYQVAEVLTARISHQEKEKTTTTVSPKPTVKQKQLTLEDGDTESMNQRHNPSQHS